MSKHEVENSWYWTPSLSVGVAAIDDDHKRLFQLFNEARLVAQSDEQDEGLLNGLAQELVLYTQSHFKREEAVMAASGYPCCEDHIATHKRFVEQVQLMLDKTLSGEGSIAEFVFMLKELFIQHIKENDLEIADYTKGFDNEIGNALLSIGPLALPGSINIFIVDDENPQVEMMTELIDVAGFTALGFTSAQVFVEQFVSNYDIVLLDLNMPVMDGIEVMRTLYNRGCTPTYILISGFDERVLHSARQFAESKNIEVASTYTKPINVKEFIAQINELHARKKIVFDKRLYQQETPSNDFEDNELSLLEFKIALSKRQFVLFYQPQVDMHSGEVKGFEALVRLQHPRHGLIFPDQFINLAEDNNLMPQLTNEIFSLAIEDYKQFQKRDINQKISINVSAHDLDLGMPERISKLLSSNNIYPEALMIELTESALRTSVSDSLDILNRLRMKGFSLSIDDFGTGYSSLVQLYQAPFTELKIDLQFVMRMLKDKEAYAIVKICILLAKELKLVTVAEGVESQEVLDELAVLGCDIAQGYHIAKPLPFDECCQWFKKRQQQLAE